MLRQLRHISEGHYYGLRVTNKAEVEHLNKELRTLDACKNVQSHCYRKEEKDLVNTLKRLKKSKEHHVEEHFGRHSKHDSGHSIAHGHKPKHHPSRESSAHPSGAQVIGSTLRMPQAKKPLPDHVVIPAGGSDIHRTTGFIDCVICNLPRSSHVKGTQICTCDKGPDKGTHHMHPPAIHDDRSRAEYLSLKERRQLEAQNRKPAKEHDERNGETDLTQTNSFHDEDKMFLNKLHCEMNKVIEQTSGRPKDFSYEKRAHSPRKGDSTYEEKGHFLFPKARRGSQVDDERFRARENSIDEEGPYTVWNRHRRGTLEEHDFRKRGPSFDNGIRERNESLGGESYYSVGELRSRTSTMEDTNVFRKTYKVPYNMHDPPSPPERQHFKPQPHSSHRFSPREETHFPQLAPQKKESTEAFHGLIHPDNIINHHHYLPYEADKPSDKRRHHDDHHSRHDDYHRRHLQGYYIHKYDHTGARQIAHIPLGANVHISEMIERQHEPDSNHFALLSNLRQLLSVYHSLEDTAPKYPWPSPPKTEMTPEEFQKLKDCRYLRLPKSMEDAVIESPVFR
ncbi:uncharacterized protein LOC116301157 [Actinia tenebrosa]|uniref:Uncharacterized protein LOC116301157 n=1 Tax=Actinia tenebrosa TaxID=6105 RepID=A0A6P8IH11_ACTTE|nr:uncharacterized protein LOC116301157 [Actinia tenebrosa]